MPSSPAMIGSLARFVMRVSTGTAEAITLSVGRYRASILPIRLWAACCTSFTLEIVTSMSFRPLFLATAFLRMSIWNWLLISELL